MRLAPGQSVGGRYDILDLLGEGGMSESYRATDRETGQTVVLKIPYANIIGDPATYSRYQRETEIGRRLEHPHIQRLLATGHLDDSVAPFLVMEYVEGESFRRYLDEHAPLPVDEAVELTRQMADALQACHERGIVHRDLKPENLLITADHQLKLIDFGIALLQGARRLTWSRLSNSVGTPDYMAPEQVRGERGDARTDVYALGTMLFEMLTGKVPYEGDNALSIMNQHVNQEAPRAGSRRSGIPPQLEFIAAKALRRDPNSRYASMAELRDDLDRWREIEVQPLMDDDYRPMGPMPSALKAAALIAAVFAALALIGFLAQLAHGTH
ncbi:MAG TPA: serine/threonine-protein kinase [Chloroflexota bacterium]|nr:serine/threonine-protein kinase [Chloroflexota bacterium]